MPSKAPGIHPGEVYFRIAKDYFSLHYYSLALEQFQRAIQETQGDAETRPLAYCQMGMIYENRNDKAKAKDCYRQAVKYGGSNPLIEKEIAQARKKLQ
jgi:tetratricopeptide (TPR) repeat protein